jgi:hypothetical protein
VLDNTEHLISGMGFAAGMLQQCPRVKLLFTSPDRLKL